MLAVFFGSFATLKSKSQTSYPSIATTEISSDPLLNTIHEFEHRATDIGYGLGVGFGRWLGTLSETSENTYSEMKDILDTYLNDDKDEDDKKFSPLSFEPREIHFDELETHDNNRCQFPNPLMLPQAVKLVTFDADEPPEDDPDVPELTSKEEAIISLNKEKHEKIYSSNFLRNITDHYQYITIKGIESTQHICDALKKIHEQGPIKLLILNGHGSPHTFTFKRASQNSIERTKSLNLDSFYSAKNTQQDLSCLKTYLDNDSKIILESCATGLNYRFRVNNGNYAFSMNIQKVIASYFPGGTVFAPDFDINFLSLKIQFEPIFKVTGKGLDIAATFEETCNKEGMDDKAQAACYRLLGPAMKQSLFTLSKEYRMGIQLLPRRPFKVVSPQNAEFCREVIPYYSMRQYCNEADVKPKREQVQVCEANPECKAILKTLREKK